MGHAEISVITRNENIPTLLKITPTPTWHTLLDHPWGISIAQVDRGGPWFQSGQGHHGQCLRVNGGGKGPAYAKLTLMNAERWGKCMEEINMTAARAGCEPWA
ncbi:hypothetical protein EMPG_16050 [Blastomyces silverae]|uniref:Uncharacterized protein n=1 Tax=Blastomyces silverae TaxID=2060906 RepID=A0A0H1BBV9_9EURO|nr:hypothetical protein EMPG_16050 [Blastomyces silverae]